MLASYTKMKNKINQNKKAQLKIQEMAFFLVAIVLFFVLVGLFVFSIVFSNLSKGATSAAEERTLSSITNLADAPEFSCGEPNCVDADKILGLMQNIKSLLTLNLLTIWLLLLVSTQM